MQPRSTAAAHGGDASIGHKSDPAAANGGKRLR
jgi:hypothetical protein